jgi:hypothetical protein
MLEMRTSRSGLPTARLRGSYLHSPYDPEAEASRFVQERLKGESPATILLLGAELGHARAALRRLHPRAGLLAVFYDPEVQARAIDRPGPEASWRPGQGPLLEFLRRSVDELHVEGLVVLEWPPSARIYPEVSLAAQRQVAQFLRERRGSLGTTAALGRRWLGNSFRNYLGLQRILAPVPETEGRPVLIAASGPTLQHGLSAVLDLRDRLALWCLPSALACLLEHGLIPDLVVSSDASYYAAAHLQPLARSPAALAMPLSACPGAWAYPGGTLLLRQDTPYEEALLAAAAYPAPRVLPQGTVAATALELALQSTGGPVILAGLDFCYLDLSGHARPSLFDLLLLSQARRTSPFDHQTFQMAGEQAPRRLAAPPARSGLALDTYAGWFAALPEQQSSRLYRLNPSPVELGAIRSLDGSGLKRLLDDQPSAKRAKPRAAPLYSGYPDRSTRRLQALSLLGGWRQACAVFLSGPLEFLEDRQFASLVYHFDAAGVAEILRLRRLRGGKAAAERAADLLERLARFLARLEGTLQETSP